MRLKLDLFPGFAPEMPEWPGLFCRRWLFCADGVLPYDWPTNNRGGIQRLLTPLTHTRGPRSHSGG
jgi:hypothetical protein